MSGDCCPLRYVHLLKHVGQYLVILKLKPVTLDQYRIIMKLQPVTEDLNLVILLVQPVTVM